MIQTTVTAKEIRDAGGLDKWLKGDTRNYDMAHVEKTHENRFCGDKGQGADSDIEKPKKRKTGASCHQKQASEHEEQKRLLGVCKLHEKKYPGLELIFAVPNGHKRTIGVARKLKEEGVQAGVPDLMLPVPRGDAHGLFVELKAQGGRVSDAQRQMMAALAMQGYACIVAYGWENAWQEIEAYMQSKTIQLWGGI